ncbi:MAG: translation initiation factor IF-2 [bacterium]|nr:translation initiation factor IF-2 [bacterium]
MKKDTQTKENLSFRPPIVVILGHVDHGKTKILDYIRQSKVAEGEAGGITQHIGAYQVMQQDKSITFLDTPGHEAFSAIRSRGAKVADIAILVVAADESVKPQTKEAIRIIEEAQVPYIVAINKVDKEGANIQRVKQDLAENNVLIEEWGGKVPSAEVSAKTGQGIDNLLETILLVAEMEELKPEGAKGKGVVIESHLDGRRGQIATLLVHEGHIKVGDWLVVGPEAIKIKSLENFLGKGVTEAGPSDPVVVSGWSVSPSLGETFNLVDSREEATKLAQSHAQLGKSALFMYESGPEKSKAKVLNLVIKADVSSSLEAIDQVLRTIHSEEVTYRVIDFGMGNISDGDIKKAVSSKAIVIGFHVAFSDQLKLVAEREKVEVLTFDIIYELLEEIKKRMSTLLDPEVNRIPLGRLKVLALFKKDVKSQIVGGKVVSGKIKRGALVDVMRSNAVVVTGRLGQLQAQKADTDEVAEGSEAGLRVDFFNKAMTPNLYIREGDILDIYEEERIQRSI